MRCNAIFFIGFLFLLTACQESPQSDSNYLIDLDKVQEYKGSKLSELLDYYDLIPLETGDDFLISNIQRMKKRNGRYYVQHNEHQLDVFDGEGRHLAKIGNRGQGPGEYPYLCDFDADNKHVYVLTVGKLISLDKKTRKVCLMK